MRTKDWAKYWGFPYDDKLDELSEEDIISKMQLEDIYELIDAILKKEKEGKKN